jgi:hypothetical protein
LFSERATVFELTFALEEKLKKELAALRAEALLNRSLQEVATEIIARYTLDTPKLDRGVSPSCLRKRPRCRCLS